MSQNSYDEISYFSNDKTGQENKIIGNIVSYKDSVFYISNMNRELVTIKSIEVNTKPYINK